MRLRSAPVPAAGETSHPRNGLPARRVPYPRACQSDYAREITRGHSVIGLIDALRPRDLVRGCGRGDRERLVTVIVPMFNAAEFVERCLKSLLIQTHQALEIVCVDDHSADDTYSRAVDQFGADRRVSVVRLVRNVGPYQIKNWVIGQISCAEFVAMQDVDDVSHPRRLERQIAALEATEADVCGTSVHQFFPAGLAPFFGDTRVFGPDGANLMHSIAAYTSLPRVKSAVPFSTALGPRRQDFIAKHGSQVFRRRVLLEFGGFDGQARFGADTDLNWRLLRFVPVLNLADVLYSRRHHPQSLTRDPNTGFGSPARQAYVLRRNQEHETIRRAIEAGDARQARSLCTRDCYAADVEVEAAHLNWSLP